jgi:TonB family protein
MSTAALKLDFVHARRRTRRAVMASVALHSLLMIWVMTFQGVAPEFPVVTEITLLEPGDLASAPAPSQTAAPAAPGKTTVSGLASASREKVQFRRGESQADIALGSESETALADRLEARLASMQRSGPASALPNLNPASILGTRPATVAGPGGAGAAPIKLNRDAGTGAPLELSRGGTAAHATLAPASIPNSAASEADAPAKAGEATAQRTIAGASLLGPVADRPVLFHSLPTYPDWAKREAVESSVTLYFVVRPNGSVKENIMIQRTAGFGDFDESARVALRAWRFEALKGGRTGEQWGTITFHFRLREAG